MRQLQILSAASLFALRAVSAYDEFYFSSSEMEWKCDGFAFTCPPPQVCSHDALLDKMYCCGAGQGAVCWNGAADCSGSNGAPASSQVGCNDNSFCCLSEREECTQREGQINICWATPENPFANATEKKMNDTFSSISSNRPSATSYTFNLERIFPTTTSQSSTSATDASSSSITDAPSSTAPAPTDTSNTPAPNNDSGLSGGAIGGIVVGVVGGLALIGAGAFFIWRRKKNSDPQQTELDSNPYAQNGYGAVAQHPPQEKYAYADAGGAGYNGGPSLPPQEMAATSAPVEVEGSTPQTRP